MIARDVEHLHNGNNLSKQTAIDERGNMVKGRGDTPNEHDILTGSRADGTAFAPQTDTTCKAWTSSTEGSAVVGHHDRTGLLPDAYLARMSEEAHARRFARMLVQPGPDDLTLAAGDRWGLVGYAQGGPSRRKVPGEAEVATLYVLRGAQGHEQGQEMFDGRVRAAEMGCLGHGLRQFGLVTSEHRLAHPAHVTAGAEPTRAAAFKHYDPECGVVPPRGQGYRDRPDHLKAQGVDRLGSVERDYAK